MKSLLEFLLNHLVAHPEEVTVTESEAEGLSIYTLAVHPDDVGKVIGKNGSVISAIRTIAKIRAMKEHLRIRVQLAEEAAAA